MRSGWAKLFATSGSPALSLTNVDAFYGDSHVLQGISFALGEGRLLGLLGRNGAGKSTCMNAVVGLVPPRRGAVTVFGKAVQKQAFIMAFSDMFFLLGVALVVALACVLLLKKPQTSGAGGGH